MSFDGVITVNQDKEGKEVRIGGSEEINSIENQGSSRFLQENTKDSQVQGILNDFQNRVLVTK